MALLLTKQVHPFTGGGLFEKVKDGADIALL